MAQSYRASREAASCITRIVRQYRFAVLSFFFENSVLPFSPFCDRREETSPPDHLRTDAYGVSVTSEIVTLTMENLIDTGMERLPGGRTA